MSSISEAAYFEVQRLLSCAIRHFLHNPTRKRGRRAASLNSERRVPTWLGSTLTVKPARLFSLAYASGYERSLQPLRPLVKRLTLPHQSNPSREVRRFG